jgi:protein translocase SecG subunit
MKTTLIIAQIVLSVTLTLLVLVQSRGTGLSRSWGSARGTSSTRRGLEKIIFKLTFLVSALFIIISIVQLSV